MDHDALKTRLICKWVIKAMHLGESNLQLVLRYILAHFNLQRGRSLGWGGLVH